MKNIKIMRLMDECFGRDAQTMSSTQVLMFAFALLEEVGIEIEKASEEEEREYLLEKFQED